MKKIRDVLRLTHARVPDNPKAGVTKPSRHEPGINRSYQDLADHYGCVMAPEPRALWTPGFKHE